jgi:hypothetical protein
MAVGAAASDVTLRPRSHRDDQDSKRTAPDAVQ